MALNYLKGWSWAEVTREERFFCQHLFTLIRQHGPGAFVEHVNQISGTSLPTKCEWEPAFEVCFYRDLWQLRGCAGVLFSPKRTFDLCLFSDDAILIIEAKAQQPFNPDQLHSFIADRQEVQKETGVAKVAVLGLASSAYEPPATVKATFDGKLLTWRALASFYQDDAILLRADKIYDLQQNGTWGKNNDGGKMTGDELVAAYRRGERFFVGRSGGIDGPKMTQDVLTGNWKTQRYETSRTASPPNRNWFELAAFARLVFR
jgi:hypothetical protein